VTGGNSLLNKDGTMCCLGFYAAACGYRGENLRGAAIRPQPVDESNFERVGIFNPVEADRNSILMPIARINDNASISDDEREQKLRVEFLRHGVTVEFVDSE
jgi:hypothetical protein